MNKVEFDFKYKHIDDGKGKYQSHEFRISEEMTGFYIEAYGEDKSEAVVNTIKELDYFIDELKKIRNKAAKEQFICPCNDKCTFDRTTDSCTCGKYLEYKNNISNIKEI